MSKPRTPNSEKRPDERKEITEPGHTKRILNPVPPATPIERIISNHPFLKGMSPRQLRVLGDFAMPAHFERDELIFREGDPANRFYLLQSGVVALEAGGSPKGRIRIEILHGGDVLGWSWLFAPY